MNLILIRHPPVIGGTDRCYGRLDLSIDESTLPGHIEIMKNWIGHPVFSSPALRCRSLAQALTTRYEIWSELQELDFGTWEGKRWDEISREEIDLWAADIWNYRPGNGESASMLHARWLLALERWQNTGIKEAVVVTHAGIIRTALAQAGLIAANERWSAKIDHARPYFLSTP